MAAPQTPGFGAAAGLTAVVPESPGKYRAHFENGTSMLVAGQAGQNLFDRHTAAQKLSAPQQPPGEAGPPPPPPAERIGTTTVSAPAPQVEPNAPVQGVPPEQAVPNQPPAQPVRLGYTMEAVDPTTGQKVQGDAIRNPDGSISVFRPGVAGSPGGMTALGKQTSEQYVKAQEQAAEFSAKAAEAQRVGTELAIQDAEARNAFVEEQKIQTQLAMQEQADEERAVQERVNSLQSTYDKAAQEFQASRVDPDRYMKSKGGGGRALTGLAAALGAFGAGMARTPNFAMDFINNRIADDMRSQEAEINVKGRAADNLLGRLTREMGDLQLAKKSFRQLQLQEASYEAELVANGTKSQQIANSARQVAAEAAAAGTLAADEKSRAFTEKVMKDRLYYRPGSAGRAAAMLTPTQGSLQAGQNLEAGRIGMAKDIKALEKQDREAAKAGGGLNANAAAQIAQIDTAIAALDRYGTMHKDMGTPGVYVEGGVFASEDSKKLSGEAVGMGPIVAKALEGDAATKESMSNVRSALLSSSGEQTQFAVKSMKQQLIDKRDAIKAGAAQTQPAAAPVPQ